MVISETGGERLDEAGRDGGSEGGFSQERRWTLWPNLSQDAGVSRLHDHREGYPGKRAGVL